MHIIKKLFRSQISSSNLSMFPHQMVDHGSSHTDRDQKSDCPFCIADCPFCIFGFKKLSWCKYIFVKPRLDVVLLNFIFYPSSNENSI